MKRTDLVRYLLKQGCVFVREGGNHSLFFNPELKKVSTLPRHKEINDFLSKKICKDLGIPPLHR
ncbi:MAG: addiction module toxin, HicA family [Candidatus Doudnabacteria bacterium RIFCSPHIGHO2_01_FULL_45_18]|uniref:Addiction module toxin, HicA family n=1 Tax=Candidatus Doudnabacteria bacterium RIFCSPHIGHO2_01_FULL_45_18 TaxID=1817823 RepID=A0A1F5NQC1_9BACT|nr:MAG: addiction module toxin, HicA family [Candidatus Doudnabacteria bacterium RIFCSPHIGHO2_01_FULL_45_18]